MREVENVDDRSVEVSKVMMIKEWIIIYFIVRLERFR